MKKTMKLQLALAALCAVQLFTACSDDGNADDGQAPTTPVIGEDVFELAPGGEQKNVEIPIAEPWEAVSSAGWLQLSQMGGKGGESVQVIAAKNLTDKERIGYIRFGEAPGTRASADSMQIVVRQPANTKDEAPGVVLTAAYYKDGGVYVEIYNGRESTSSMQELTIVGSAFSFTDPDATVPVKDPPKYVGQGKYYTFNPYVILDADGVAEGKFAIAGEQSVNTLRVKQNVVFNDLGQLGNEGSAGLHFTDGNVIYYGGGIIKQTDTGYQQTTPSYEFRSYNTATGEETAYADIPESGAGAVWDGNPVIVGAEGVYVLDGGQWLTAALRTAPAVAAAVEGNTLYAVTSSAIET